MPKIRQPKLSGNQNAAKPADQRRTSLLQIPVTTAEKAQLVQAAHPGKLAAWARRHLFQAARAADTTSNPETSANETS